MNEREIMERQLDELLRRVDDLLLVVDEVGSRFSDE